MKRAELVSNLLITIVFIVYSIIVATMCVSIGKQLERVETRQRFIDIGEKESYTNQDIEIGLFGNIQE